MPTAVAKRGRPQEFSTTDLRKAIREAKKILGRVPTISDFGTERPEGWPSASTLAYRFGSFSNAIVAAGYVRPGRGRRPKH